MRHHSTLRSRSPAGAPARRLSGLLVRLTLLACCGCGPAPVDAPPETPGNKPPEAAPDASQSQARDNAPPKEETWFVCYMEGARVGYEHAATTTLVRDGRELLRIETRSHLALKRFGQQIEMDMRFSSIETLQGQLVEFDGEISQGPVPMRISGSVVGDELRIETTTMGKTRTSSIPWSAEYGGFRAAEQSLARKPMKPGEQRTIHVLTPGIGTVVVATDKLLARDYEPTRLLTGTHDLLRIDTATTLSDGPTMQGAVWTDRTGRVLKNRLEAMNIETFRATRAEALAQTEPPEFDLGVDVAVKVSRPLPSAHKTKRVRYRVKLEGGDPVAAFVSGPSQEVKSIDPHTAEVTVYALLPDGPAGNRDAPPDPPSDDDRNPNNLVQSDYPAIVAKARKVAGGQTDPWQAALALERSVHQSVKLKGYTQAFATAAEVIDSGEGDCTEHAMLLAALARARGIPARAAIGLVYKDRAFYYHMWTEVYAADRWIPLDATLGQGGIGAAHLKMAHSNLKGASALSSLLPVLQVIGRLEIEVLDSE